MMDRSVDKLVDYLAKVVKSDTHGVIDTKAVIAGFSLDTFASTSFGIDTNTNNDRSDTNRLLSSALKFTHISPLVGICYYAMPKWFNRLINVKHFFNVESFDYFENVAREVVRQRIQSKSQPEFTKRNDVLDLLIDAVSYEENVEESTNYDRLTADMGNDVQENSTNLSSVTKAKTTLSEMEIIAQTIAFFVAGYETTASAISHTLFELAINQTIQKRLAIELADALQNLDDNSEQYYETVCHKIPYLDAVINETLRKYPVLYRLERRCVVDGFKLAGIPLQKDQVIEIAKYATHYNAEYFPEPELFNPDRFMPENKHLLVPYSFLPFGQGPRNCIGMRFAYQEIKLCLTKIVRQFVFRSTAQTPAKLQLSNYQPVLGTKAFEIKVEMR